MHGGFRFALLNLQRLKRVLAPLMLACAFTGSPARAQTVPELPTQQEISPDTLAAYPKVRAYIEQNRLHEALAALQAEQPRHDDDPDYFNLLGILALKVADYLTAVAAFERVVLMQPDNAGAWLDLAIAATETGNVASAAAYFDYIEQQFGPPAPVRVIIARYRARLVTRTDVSPWLTTLEALVGVDTNANAGLQNSAIPLTFGVDRVELVLDPSFQARSDRFAQAGVATRYRQTLGNNVAELGMILRTREYQNEKSFSTISANLAAGLQRATGIGDASTWLYLEHLWLGGNPLLRNLRAVAQLERPIQRCRLGISAEAEWRRYATLNALDSNILWGQAGVACDWKLANMPFQTILIGRTGFDDPVGNRTGLDIRHNELVAQIGMPVAFGARADLSITLARARDAEGYSPLLEQNAARRLDRRNIRFLFTVPLALKTDFQLLVEDNHFDSNLALFQQKGQTLNIGLRHSF